MVRKRINLHSRNELMSHLFLINLLCFRRSCTDLSASAHTHCLIQLLKISVRRSGPQPWDAHFTHLALPVNHFFKLRLKPRLTGGTLEISDLVKPGTELQTPSPPCRLFGVPRWRGAHSTEVCAPCKLFLKINYLHQFSLATC